MTPIGRGNQNSQEPYGYQLTQGETDSPDIQSVCATSTSTKAVQKQFRTITQIFRKQIELAVKRRGGVKTEISNELGLSREDLIGSLTGKKKQKSVYEDDFPKLEGLVSKALSPKELELSLEDLESLIKNQNPKKRKGRGRGKGSETITELFRKQIVVAVARTDGNKLTISGALNLSHRKLLYCIIEGSVAKGRHRYQKSVKRADFSKLDKFVSHRLSTEERKLSLEELDRLLEECQVGQRKIEPLVPFRDPSEFSVSSLVGVDHQSMESSFNSFEETANPDELTLALLPSTPEGSAAVQEERREPTYNDPHFLDYGGWVFNSNPAVLPVGSSFNSFEETANPIDELTLALLPPTTEGSAAVQEERREPTYNDPHFLDYGGGGFNSNPAVLPVGSSDSPFEGMPGSFALELALSEGDPN